MNLESNIWKYYIYAVFRNLTFFTPILVLFWQELGLSMTQIMLLQAIFSITVVLLEVPTGYFADLYGRKLSLQFAGLFLFIGMALYFFAISFWSILVSELFWALGFSLISGSDTALIYDTLKELGREKDYKKIWGNVIFISLLGMMIADIAGGYLGNYNYRLTFLAMTPGLLLMIPLAFTFKEPTRHKLIIKKGYLKKLLLIIKKVVIENKQTKWLLIYSAVAFGFNQVGFWLFQPYLKLTGLTIIQIGFAFALFQLFSGFVSKFSYKLEPKLGKKVSLASLFILAALTHLLMARFVFFFSFLFILLHQFVRGFQRIIVTDYLHELTESNVRATVLSVYSLMTRLGYALIIPVVGYITDVYDIITTLYALGITTIVIGSITLVITLSTLKSTNN